MARRCGASRAVRDAARKPRPQSIGEATAPAARANRQWAAVGASAGLDDAPHRLRPPSCPPLGPLHRPRDLYGPISRTFGIRAPITVHEDSDACGVAIFGPQGNAFWHDHSSAKLNAIRSGTLIAGADVVVVRFGEKYKRWNAAFDAGYAAALGKPIITLHPPAHDHALKEVDAAAKAVTRDPAQVVQALAYVTRGALPR